MIWTKLYEYTIGYRTRLCVRTGKPGTPLMLEIMGGRTTKYAPCSWHSICSIEAIINDTNSCYRLARLEFPDAFGFERGNPNRVGNKNGVTFRVLDGLMCNR